jgi:hypothetical protein
MKYLKTFEHTIKHSDPMSVNHPLKDFSRKLEDIIIEIMITLMQSKDILMMTEK